MPRAMTANPGRARRPTGYLRRAVRLALVFAGLAALILTIAWVVRATEARALPDLAPWHTFAPVNEFAAANFPAGISWPEYRALEARLAAELDDGLYDRLPDRYRGALNRYDRSSRMYAGAEGARWNYSFELPVDAPVGSILLLHGASDSPYSFRALAERFNQAGLHVLALRLPGNGTLPQGLTRVRLADWTAVAELGVRYLDERLGRSSPVYLGGYSMGAPLALEYTLRALADTSLRRPDALLLYSPAIAVSPYARFARWDTLLSRVPVFRKFAWLTVQPEYDPYKYNSFAKNVGIISHELTRAVREGLLSLRESGRYSSMPPVLAFQSVVDATVSTEAVVDHLFRDLPANGSQLVLFDMNRMHLLQHMLDSESAATLSQLFDGPPLRFDVTLVSNRTPATNEVAATTREAASERARWDALPYRWPDGVYSLSHVAVPFEASDPWYGAGSPGDPDAPLTLGNVAPRGEKSVLRADVQNLMRLRYNPFFDYVADRSLVFVEGDRTGREGEL